MAVKLAFHVEGTECSRTPTLSIGASTLYETLLSCGWYAIGHPDFTPPKTPPISASRKALQAPDGNATHGLDRLESLEEPFFSIRKGFSDCSEIQSFLRKKKGFGAKPKTLMAENTRFELVRLLHQHAFQACAIDH